MAQLEPTGVGVYLRATGPMPPPRQAAKIAKDAGVSFVAFFVVQQDISKGRPRTTTITSVEDVRRYGDAFATVGINPWLWGYPWAGREAEFVERMEAATTGNVVGWILDPELGYKWKGSGTRARSGVWRAGGHPGQKEADPNAPPPTGSQAAMQKAASLLMSYSLDALTEKHGLGVTSYGMADYHRNFPWPEFQAGWGSPQLYEVEPAQVDQGIASWRTLGWNHIVPSVPAFGSKSGANLHDFLSTFVDGSEGIAGFIVWSWPQISPDEWRVFRRWSDWFARYPQIVR